MLDPKEEITITYSEFPKELDEVVNKTHELMLSIIELRKRYKNSKLLPLIPVNSDYENLNKLLYCIELEVLKFGKPGVIRQEFHEFSKEELKEILLDKDEILNLGLDEWIEEGLLKSK